MNPVPGVIGFGTGTLTATAPPEGALTVVFYDRYCCVTGARTVTPGRTLMFPPQDHYVSVKIQPWTPDYFRSEVTGMWVGE